MKKKTYHSSHSSWPYQRCVHAHCQQEWAHLACYLVQQRMPKTLKENQRNIIILTCLVAYPSSYYILGTYNDNNGNRAKLYGVSVSGTAMYYRIFKEFKLYTMQAVFLWYLHQTQTSFYHKWPHKFGCCKEVPYSKVLCSSTLSEKSNNHTISSSKSMSLQAANTGGLSVSKRKYQDMFYHLTVYKN